MDRAERASERAARAAERAAEAADRASERGQGDGRGERAERGEENLRRDGVTDVEYAPDDVDRAGLDADEFGSNSGSNSGSDNDDIGDIDDNSGRGSDNDDDDEDEEGREDERRDQQFVVVPVESDDGGNPYREGEIVIMSDDAGLVARAQALGFGILEARELVSIGAVVARLRRPEGVSSSAALELLRTREPASPSGYNYIYRSTGHAIDVPMDEQRDGVSASAPARSRIGIIDGFATREVAGWQVERLTTEPAGKGHGETVATILLRDLSDLYRMQPERMLLLDVMRHHGDSVAADVTALVLAFDRLVTERADLANLSLAGPDHPALRRAVEMSLRKGMVIVAAVGNEGPAAPPVFPAAYDGVVGVAAVDSANRPYLYSGRGRHVDIAALGVEQLPAGAGQELIGTSYAAPRVSALLASQHAVNRHASIDAVLAAFAEDAGEPGRDPIYGVGILTSGPKMKLALAADGH